LLSCLALVQYASSSGAGPHDLIPPVKRTDSKQGEHCSSEGLEIGVEIETDVPVTVWEQHFGEKELAEHGKNYQEQPNQRHHRNQIRQRYHKSIEYAVQLAKPFYNFHDTQDAKAPKDSGPSALRNVENDLHQKAYDGRHHDDEVELAPAVLEVHFPLNEY
jgi:hypothetical protein